MNKKALLILTAVLLSAFALTAQQTLTDMAGRSVTLPEPEEIVTIFTANPTASVFLYTLDMDRMAGWNLKLYRESKPLLPAQVRNLPSYGTLYGNGKAVSEEEVFMTDPQLILVMGDITKTMVTTADELAGRFGLPVVVLDSDIEALPEAYDLLGDICGREDRASELGAFCEKVLEDARELTASLTEEEKKSVFYSLSADGLSTYPIDTSLSDYMDLCGAVNVADIPYEKKMGHVAVSFEQLVTWNPEYILAGSFANSPANEGSIYNQPRWKAMDAQVCLIPYIPFDSFAKPPSVNRIAGILWLQDLLYPEKTDYDLQEELDAFNTLFYSLEG